MKFFTNTSRKSMPIKLESDDFLSYHRVVRVQIPMITGDTLSVTINTEVTLESFFKKILTFSASICKVGSTVFDVKEDMVITEIHVKLITKGNFMVSCYGKDGKELMPAEKFKLKKIKK